MKYKSSFCFGILFLLKASFAQSAPHSYAEEDEEALIDRLASLAAAVGSNPKNYQPQNYDLSQLGYPDLNDDAGFSRDSVLKLPRQFGYKPNDLRFYLPADQFPLYPSQGAEELQQQLEQQQNVNYEVPPPQNQQQRLPLSIPVNSNPSPVTSPQGQNQNVQRHVGGGQPEVMADGQSDFYFMKKKEQANQGPHDSPIRSYVPGPSHVMSSGHSANYPGFTSSPVDEKQFTYSDMYYIAIIAGCSAAAVVGLVAAGVCWYRIHERIKAAADVDYPAYGVTGPSKDISPSGGDRKLAQSAQMYHYQHQKQQMAALQKGAIQGERQGSGGSDVESEDDNEDGDYTVYECPGLAPAGEMEVKNPLFHDEPTPATPQTQGQGHTNTKGNDETENEKGEKSKQQQPKQPDSKSASTNPPSTAEKK